MITTRRFLSNQRMEVSAANYFLVSHDPYVETINQFCRLVMMITMIMMMMVMMIIDYEHDKYDDPLLLSWAIKPMP